MEKWTLPTVPFDLFPQIIHEVADGVYVVDRRRRILFWNQSAERITGYPASEVIGHFCWHNLLDHVDRQGCQLCFTGCPLQATIADRAPRESLVSLKHREGHRVPVRVRTRPLVDAEGMVWGAVETFSDATGEELTHAELERLRQLALVDPLTELGNRRFLEGQLESTLRALQRYGWGFGLLVLDLDHFKRVNDTYGHLVGDAVLRMVATTIGNHIRRSDSVGRWGGEEFVVIARHVDSAQLGVMAEHLRALVASSALPQPAGAIQVTVSMGGTIARVDDEPDTLFARADQLLYSSKQNGRDQVTLG